MYRPRIFSATLSFGYSTAGKFGGDKFGESGWMKTLVENVWWMNRSAKWLLIVTINLDGLVWHC